MPGEPDRSPVHAPASDDAPDSPQAALPELPDDLATLTTRANGGDAGATNQLFEVLYRELHRLARREVRRLGPQATLGTTTLLHEVYLDLSRRDALAFPTKGHFMAYAARAMRGLVIDRVRERSAQKRGGGLDITSLDTELAEQCEQPELLSAVGEALDELATLDPSLAQVVDLKFFCGFSMNEVAALMNTSERTAQRQWQKARLLLFRALQTE